MTPPLNTYLQDHLAGARFALDLLQGLSEQTIDPPVARFASLLLNEIGDDCATLQTLVDRIGGDPSRLKEFAAWTAQKASRMKLDLNEPIGIFEAIEMLTLGVQGKLALWNALRIVQTSDARLASLDVDRLTTRAVHQFAMLEDLRLQRAVAALVNSELANCR